MKLKLTQPGYENFTGLMGAVDFVNGVSSQYVSEQQAAGILNIIRGERLEDLTMTQAPEPQAVPPAPVEQVPEAAVQTEPVVEPVPAVAEPVPAE